MRNVRSLFFTNMIKFYLNELTRNLEFEFEKHARQEDVSCKVARVKVEEAPQPRLRDETEWSLRLSLNYLSVAVICCDKISGEALAKKKKNQFILSIKSHVGLGQLN